ncbi:uncharacterized protein L199_007562 [Kwoniella botswanensis]|uniref:uncharacterized protein n=1 Tax=Kwoniella botswanensis TaxID=1268659 RepID=UPI00315C4D92
MTISTPTFRSRSSSLSSIKSVVSTALSYLIPSRQSNTHSRSKPELPSIDTSFSPRIELRPSDKTSTDVRPSQSKIPNFSRHLNRHDSGYAPSSGSITATSSSIRKAPIDVFYGGEGKNSRSYSTSSSSRPSLSLNALSSNGSVDDLHDRGRVTTPHYYSRWRTGEEDDQEEWRHTPTPRTSSDRWSNDDDEDDDYYDYREEESNDPPPGTFIGNTGRERSNTSFSLLSQQSDDSCSSNGIYKPRKSLNRRSLDILSSLNSRLLFRSTPKVRELPERNRSWLGEDDALPEPLRIYPPKASSSDQEESSSEPYDDHSVSLKRIDHIRDLSQNSDDESVKTGSVSANEGTHTHHKWRDRLKRTFSRSSSKSDMFSGGNGRRRSMIGSIMDILSGNTSKTSLSEVADDRPKIEPDDVDGSSVGIRPLSRTSSGLSTATTRLKRIKGDLMELFSGFTKSLHGADDSKIREKGEEPPYPNLDFDGPTDSYESAIITNKETPAQA